MSPPPFFIPIIFKNNTLKPELKPFLQAKNQKNLYEKLSYKVSRNSVGNLWFWKGVGGGGKNKKKELTEIFFFSGTPFKNYRDYWMFTQILKNEPLYRSPVLKPKPYAIIPL